MLVLSRKLKERILIGNDPETQIVVTVVRLGPNNVRLGIDAPDDVVIIREELEDLQEFLSDEQQIDREETNQQLEGIH